MAIKISTEFKYHDARSVYLIFPEYLQGVSSLPTISLYTFLELKLRKLLPLHSPRPHWLLLPCLRIIRIQVRQRQTQKLMLVRPPDLALGELLRIRGTRRRVRDLGDQVRGRRFGDAVDQDAE